MKHKGEEEEKRIPARIDLAKKKKKKQRQTSPGLSHSVRTHCRRYIKKKRLKGERVSAPSFEIAIFSRTPIVNEGSPKEQPLRGSNFRLMKRGV